MADTIAKAYGDALFEIALDTNKCEKYRDIVQVLKNTISDELIRLLSHPKISKTEKKQILENIYGKEVDEIFLNFFKVLIDKNRFYNVCAIFDEFDANYIQHFNIIQANVWSARELSKDEKNRLEEKLSKKYSQKVECTYEVDESLLAGIKVKVKDEVMDNSAINRLNKMKDSIMG
jgi:F-type H+-transporting ATPase subunit delta